jgi:hypothetical protein
MAIITADMRLQVLLLAVACSSLGLLVAQRFDGRVAAAAAVASLTSNSTSSSSSAETLVVRPYSQQQQQEIIMQSIGNLTIAMQSLLDSQNQFTENENGMRNAFIRVVEILMMGSWSPPPPSAVADLPPL